MPVRFIEGLVTDPGPVGFRLHASIPRCPSLESSWSRRHMPPGKLTTSAVLPFHLFDDLTESDAEGRGQADHVEQADVAFSSLHVSYIGTMDASQVGEGLLGDAGSRAELPHGFAECRFGPVFLAHEAKLCPGRL